MTTQSPDQTRFGRWLTRHFAYTAMDGSFTVVLSGQIAAPIPRRCRSLHRWQLAAGRLGKLYLHAWEGDDWSTDLHDHSARMLSIGLWGSYAEDTPRGTRIYRAPWVRTFPAMHRHRIRVRQGPVWTLIWLWPTTQRSAFYVDGRRIGATAYLRSAWADRHKAC